MKKFKLLALALAIGTGSLFAHNLDAPHKQELDEEYDLEELYDEAYEDAAFYKELQQENQTHSRDIAYTSKNLNAATIADDNHGLEVFEALLNDNYEMYLNDDSFYWDMNLKDQQSVQTMKLCADVFSTKR